MIVCDNYTYVQETYLYILLLCKQNYTLSLLYENRSRKEMLQIVNSQNSKSTIEINMCTYVLHIFFLYSSVLIVKMIEIFYPY